MSLEILTIGLIINGSKLLPTWKDEHILFSPHAWGCTATDCAFDTEKEFILPGGSVFTVKNFRKEYKMEKSDFYEWTTVLELEYTGEIANMSTKEASSKKEKKNKDESRKSKFIWEKGDIVIIKKKK